jgi:hypothetical protein
MSTHQTDTLVSRGGTRRFTTRPWMVIAAFGVGVLLWLNAEHGAFRFALIDLGAFSLFAAMAFLWVGALLPLRLRARWARIAGAIGVALFGVATFLALPGLMIGSLLAFGGTERVQKVPMNGYDVTLYRSNCGATCHYGLRLQQEWPLILGIVRVREVRRWYPAAEGTVRRVDQHRVHVTVLPYDPSRDDTGSEEQIDLEPRMFAFEIGRRPPN